MDIRWLYVVSLQRRSPSNYEEDVTEGVVVGGGGAMQNTEEESS